ncbi:FtsX-like permease family protein [Gemmatimonadota bacterium]
MRSLAAVAGIGFSMIFIYLQLGLLGASLYTATSITSHLRADLVLVSPRFVHLASAGTISRGRLYQVLGDPEITDAMPLYVRMARWRAVGTRRRCNLMAIGARMGGTSPVTFKGIQEEEWDGLLLTQTMLVDQATHPKCGTLALGEHPEVREKRVRIEGDYRLGVGFMGDGSLLVNDQTFSQLFGNHPLDQPQMGLIRVARGANPREVRDRLRSLLPGDVRIITAGELNQLQIRHWIVKTSLGIIFSIGTFVGFIIGLAILYQTLSTDILQQLPQYATLKSMGYPETALNGMVLRQSLIFGFLGLAPATLISLVMYWALRVATNLPIGMTTIRLALVISLAGGMCAFSGVLATRKLTLADPADLY